MKNIIKAEFHKIFHSIFFYAMPLGLLATLMISVLASNEHSATRIPNQNFIQILSETLDFMVIVIVCAGIFLTYLWGKERKNGYIKNIAGNVKGRHILTLSKLITGSAVVAMYSFFMLIFNTLFKLCYALINGGKFSFIPIGLTDADRIAQMSPEALKSLEESKEVAYSTLRMSSFAFFAWIFGGIAVAAMLLMFFEFFRSPVLGYILSIQLLPMFAEGLIEQAVYLVTKFEKTGEYMIVKGLMKMKTLPDAMYGNAAEMNEFYPNSIGGTIIMLCVYITVFSLAAVFISKRKDV